MAGRDQEMAPHPFFKIVVNAVFLKYEKITKASNFLDFSQPRNRSVNPLRFTDRNDRSPYPFIHFNL